MQYQKVESTKTHATRLEVGEQRLWRDVRIYCLWVSEFLYPCVFDNGEDELRSLSPRRLVGTVVRTLCFVRGFGSLTDDGRGIVVHCLSVNSNYCGFNECRTVARCVRCHWPNKANEVVCSSRFVIRHLEEERRHDLPNSREVCFGKLSVNRIKLFERISEFCHNFFGCYCVRKALESNQFGSLQGQVPPLWAY